MLKTILISSIMLLLNGQSEKPINTLQVDPASHVTVTCFPANQSSCNCTVESSDLINPYSELLPSQNASKGCDEVSNTLFCKVTSWLSSEAEDVEKENTQSQNTTLTPRKNCWYPRSRLNTNPTIQVGQEYSLLLKVVGYDSCIEYNDQPGVSAKVFYNDSNEIVDWVIPNVATSTIKYLPQKKHKGEHQFRLEIYSDGCIHTKYFYPNVILTTRSIVIQNLLLGISSFLVGLGLGMCWLLPKCYKRVSGSETH